MYEMNTSLVNDVHRQNIEREFKQQRNIRDANLARQDAKRERQRLIRLQNLLTRKTR